jgi:hypothetical protein
VMIRCREQSCAWAKIFPKHYGYRSAGVGLQCMLEFRHLDCQTVILAIRACYL